MEPLSLSCHASWTEAASRNAVPRPQPKSACLPTTVAGKPAWSNTISMQALLQRLSLLAELELPCIVQFGNCRRDHSGNGPIRQCRCSDGRFKLSGENFSLQLNEATIDSVRVIDSPCCRPRDTCIEILSTHDNVIARIKGAPDCTSAGVWQDVMDTFAFA